MLNEQDIKRSHKALELEVLDVQLHRQHARDAIPSVGPEEQWTVHRHEEWRGSIVECIGLRSMRALASCKLRGIKQRAHLVPDVSIVFDGGRENVGAHLVHISHTIVEHPRQS